MTLKFGVTMAAIAAAAFTIGCSSSSPNTAGNDGGGQGDLHRAGLRHLHVGKVALVKAPSLRIAVSGLLRRLDGSAET